MKTRVARDASLLRRLAENGDESASVAILVQLCRESPQLRHWLWADFGRDAKVRRKFAKVVRDASTPVVGNFLELTNDASPWLKERRRLQNQLRVDLYGGLTWNKVTQLIRFYQAGTIDLGVFLLAHDWRKAGKSSPRLQWAGIEFFELVIPSGRRRLLKHLDKALAFLRSYEDKPNRRSRLGYANWWKLHVLFYILRHPCESYQTRELYAHLVTLGLKVGKLDIRRFCNRHGIKRDMLAGRPRSATRTKLNTVTTTRPTNTRKDHKASSL